jgi:hypothetical protein
MVYYSDLPRVHESAQKHLTGYVKEIEKKKDDKHQKSEPGLGAATEDLNITAFD